MNQTVPQQHPAVVLRSHYQHLRSLLAILMVALVGLSAAVVILATDDGTTTAAKSTDSIGQSLKGTPFRGGSDESAVAEGISSPPAVARPDETKVAAAIAAREHFYPKGSPRPELSRSESSRPDESGVAAAISSAR